MAINQSSNEMDKELQQNMIPEFTDGFFCINSVHGFLPIHDPIHVLPSHYHILQDNLDNLPSLIHTLSSSAFRMHINDTLPNYILDIKNETDTRVITALYRGYCFLSSAYVLHSAHEYFIINNEYGLAHPHLTEVLAAPLLFLAEKLNVYPWLEYSYGYSLGNFVRIHPNASLDYDNLKMANRFTETSHENGFIMVHVDINQFTPQMIQCCDAILYKYCLKKNENPHDDLVKLVAVLENMNCARKKMWTASDPCHYNDFRVFIMGIEGNSAIFPNGLTYGNETEPRFYRGQSGSQDSIIPFLDNFFRICDHYPSNTLTEYLYDMRRYRPKPFRDLLDWIHQHTVDIIPWILSFPMNADVLYKVYREIYRFRHGHWRFVQKYIMRNTTYPIATGGTPIISWIPNQIVATINAMKVTNHDDISILEARLHQDVQALDAGHDIFQNDDS